MTGSAPMRRSRLAPLYIVLLLLTAPASVAVAQDLSDGGLSDGAEPAEETAGILVDDDTGERYRLERPPPGMRRGDLPVPAWVPVTAGVLVVLVAAGALLLRARRRKA